MEDNLQTIIGTILSVFMLFIFPVYMAYEKKDDISYSLAMRYTQELVDEVRSKGYITKSMYEGYEKKLKLTGNSYDIKLTHEYKRYDPITNYYTLENKKYVLVQTSTQEARKKYEKGLIDDAIRGGGLTENSSEESIKNYLNFRYNQSEIYKVENTYRLSQEINTEEYIKSVLYNEKKLQRNSQSDVVFCSDFKEDGCEYAYIMNVDDRFNITIKNTNTTLATVIYNMVTAHLLDENTRIYVNYGGDILANKWRDNIDYAKTKHDNLSLSKFEETVVFLDEKSFGNETFNGVRVAKRFTDEYVLDFDVQPKDVTELGKKGDLDKPGFSGYNFAMGGWKYPSQFVRNYLSVSVGINGISLINSSEYSTPTINQIDSPQYATPVGSQQIIQNRKIDEFSKIKITDGGQGRLVIEYTLKSDGSSIAVEKQVTDDEYLFKNISWTWDNGFKPGDVVVYSHDKVKLTVETGVTSFIIYASKPITTHTTILSYPTDITDYTNVRIEFVKKDKDASLYIANLYLDGIKVEESIPMTQIPEIEIVGNSRIDNEDFYFNGNMKNVKIYSK